jgi:hypothetical protein
MGQNKLLIGMTSAAGIVLLLVVGYQFGQKQPQPPMQAGSPMMQGAPGAGTGPGNRMQETAEKGKGERRGRRLSDGSAPEKEAKRGTNRAREVQVRESMLGSDKIAVIASGKQKSFTGNDLQSLEQKMVATTRGVRKGWMVAEVMKYLEITNARELVLVNKEGKTLSLPWENLKNQKGTVILFYDKLGGLVLVSGAEMTAEELETADNRAVRAAMRQVQAKDRIFLSDIVKIEVKT